MAATSIQGSIYEALVSRCADMATALGISISMPNVAFTPPLRSGARMPYLFVRYMPNGSDFDGLPFDGDVTHIGLMQVSVFWPASEGLVKPTDMASKVADWFPGGLELVQGQAKVNVDRAPTIAASLQESDLVQVPVTIRWRASAINP